MEYTTAHVEIEHQDWQNIVGGMPLEIYSTIFWYSLVAESSQNTSLNSSLGFENIDALDDTLVVNSDFEVVKSPVLSVLNTLWFSEMQASFQVCRWIAF